MCVCVCYRDDDLESESALQGNKRKNIWVN